jgi:DNA-binding transcriptional LysR family regulator
VTSEGPGETDGGLRVSFVPGVTPDKWARIWAERMPRVRLELAPVEEEDQTAVLFDGRADMCFVRLPVDQDGLHVIPLYREVPVVVAPKEHFVEAADEVVVADLADEHLLQDPDLVPEWRDIATEIRQGTRPEVPPITTRQAIETVAAGVGIVIVPMSVARLHHRRDVVHRPVVDVAETQIGLAWRREQDNERVQTFIGVVRGRSANSSRGTTTPPAPKSTRKPVPKDRSPARRRRSR